MLKLIIPASAAAAAAIALTPALAQSVHQPAPQMRAHTRAEVVTHVQATFARLDANRDGYLTKEEAQAGRMHRRMRAGHRMTAGHGARAFERLDANRDGAISRAEWDARVAERQQRRAARGDARDGMKMARGMRMFGAGLRGRMFDMADADRDGRVTMAEAQSAALQHFDRVDLNRDGTITPEERRQAREQFRAQRRG